MMKCMKKKLKQFDLGPIRFVLGLILALIIATPAHAIPILNVTPTSPTTVPSCTLHPGSGDEVENGTGVKCKSTAYQPSLADWNSTFIVGNFDGTAPTNQTFQTAFNNWNANEGANYGGNWVLQLGGGNLDLTFNVTDTASANNEFGGISNFSINALPNADYQGLPFDQLVWVQALYVSYSTTPPYNTDLIPPLITLDTYSNSKGNTGSVAFLNACDPIPGQSPGADNSEPATIGASAPNTAYCDPIYPFQYDGLKFFDAPQAYWPDESFRAIALLSTVTFVTDANSNIIERDLTVYNGVSWGFDLSVPEPSTISLVGLSLAMLAIIRIKGKGG